MIGGSPSGEDFMRLMVRVPVYQQRWQIIERSPARRLAGERGQPWDENLSYLKYDRAYLGSQDVKTAQSSCLMFSVTNVDRSKIPIIFLNTRG